jgi:uncharacterized integral membrane protein
MLQRVFVVLICLIVLAIACFNSFSIPLNLANNTISVPLTAVIIIAFTFGVAVGYVLLYENITAHKTHIKELKRKIVFLETPDTHRKQD